jgi:hypothetical protein
MEGFAGIFYKAGNNPGEIGARTGLISLDFTISPFKVSREWGRSISLPE